MHLPTHKARKLRGSSLYFALVVVLLSTLFIIALIQLFEWNKNVHRVIDRKLNAQQHLSEAWLLATHPKTIYPLNNQFPLVLGIDTLQIKKSNYGLFYLIQINDYKNDLSKTGLISNQNLNDSLALFMSNLNSPLALAGDTKIIGSALVSERSIKRGHVGQIGYNGKELIEGRLILRNTPLPSIDSSIKNSINNLTQQLDYLNQFDNQSHQFNQNSFSFNNDPEYFYSNDPLILDQQINGNGILFAPQITVLPNSKLEDLILVANEIIIKSGTRAACQLIATDSIKVEQDVKLLFPSAICVTNSKKTALEIAKNSQIEGLVIQLSDSDESILKIGENGVIQGQLYSTAPVELKGKILGSCLTNEFISKTASIKYINYIFNGVIDKKSQSPYTQVSVLENNTENNRKTLKWLGRENN